MAKKEQEHKDIAYRIYVTDALCAVYNLNKRYFDEIAPDKGIPCDETSKEIITRISAGLEAL